MIKYCKNKWNKNKELLIANLKSDNNLNECDYLYLVKKTVNTILNDNGVVTYSIDNITEINNGDYQGTLLYVIPEETYQPSEYEYLMTYVSYGSCSGCDTLQSIQSLSCDTVPTEEQLREFTKLCMYIIQNIIKPYNNGWRNKEEFMSCD